MTVKTEILSALCKECNCCLANGPHCWICHTSVTIKQLCGCGDCDGQAALYVETQALRVKKAQIRYRTSARIAK
jgi:hypothetical protein